MNALFLWPALRQVRWLSWWLALGLAILSGEAAPGKAKAGGGASDAFFASGLIPQIHIEVDSTNMNRLRRNGRAYARATIREGDRVWEEVGIHLKGAAGSNRALDSGEPALTLNFDKFRDRQKFHGLDKLHLNNSVQDSSYLCEAVCSQLFLEAGVPTARTTHARVWLNGREQGHGLYVLKEGYDKGFLLRHFESDQGNLYDGGFIREVTDDLELKSAGSDVAKRADLKALAAAAQESDPALRLDRLQKILDVDRFLSFLAMEDITWHWDGYMMKKKQLPGVSRSVRGQDLLHRARHGPDVLGGARRDSAEGARRRIGGAGALADERGTPPLRGAGGFAGDESVHARADDEPPE